VALGIGIREFRDHLTDYAFRVERGEALVVSRLGRGVVLIRQPEAPDRGAHISITRLRRQACRAVRLAERRPLLVYWHCRPSLWMGPMPTGIVVERLRRPRRARERAA
jgi:hypothetical protein